MSGHGIKSRARTSPPPLDQATALRQAIERQRSAPVGVPAIETPVPERSWAHEPRGGAKSARRGSEAPAGARRPAAPAPKLARAIAISSGKGGVGKSNLAVNLAVALSRLGQRVCLIDADLGMANADVLCNLNPPRTLEHVMTGQCPLARAAVLAPGGFRLIPGASGVPRIADMGEGSRTALLRELARLEQVADLLLIDTGAGISANVLGFAAAAHTQLVITTPEPTALTDCYGLVKALSGRLAEPHVEVVVNMVEAQAEADDVHRRLDRVSRAFLRRSVGYAGAIPTDPMVAEAVRMRVPFVLYAPDSPATRAIWPIARQLAGLPDVEANEDGFFARVARFFRA